MTVIVFAEDHNYMLAPALHGVLQFELTTQHLFLLQVGAAITIDILKVAQCAGNDIEYDIILRVPYKWV